jgi:hypothetical protein
MGQGAGSRQVKKGSAEGRQAAEAVAGVAGGEGISDHISCRING